MMEALTLFLMGLLGILIHVAFKFQDTVTKVPKNGNSFEQRLSAAMDRFDLLGNAAYGLLALLIIILVVAIRKTLGEVGFPITHVTIPFIGYAADSAFKNMSKLKQ